MNVVRSLPHDWFPRALPENVIFGERSWCYSAFAFVHYRSERPCGVRVGADTGIYNGTFFDLGPDGEVEIGCFSTLVGAIIATNARVEIGDYAFLAHEVVLADSFAARPGARDGVSQSENAQLASAAAGHRPALRGIRLGNNCWIGARAVLLSGAVIGGGAIVGAGAVVDFEVPPNSLVVGNPAQIIKRTH